MPWSRCCCGWHSASIADVRLNTRPWHFGWLLRSAYSWRSIAVAFRCSSQSHCILHTSVESMNLNPFAWSFRAQCAAGFVVCAALYAYALYVQFALGIEPCPMCIFQRIAFIAMAFLFLVGAIHGPRARGRRVYALLLLLSACIGIG